MGRWNDSIKKTLHKSYLQKSNKELLFLAEKYYSRCLTIAKKQKNLDSILYYSEALSQLQDYKGDYKNAFTNLQLRNKINDSLYSQKKTDIAVPA